MSVLKHRLLGYLCSILLCAVSVWSLDGLAMSKSVKPSNAGKLDAPNVASSVSPQPVHPTPANLGKDDSSASEHKQQLETQKLEYDLGSGRRLEWIKAFGPYFTGLGLFVTLGLGISQLRQSQQSREDERFERAVTRLASQQTAERLTGIAGLQQFLTSSDSQRQESTLTFIVNAAVIEENQTVRTALLDVLDRLVGYSMQKSALDSAIVTARDRNRAILKRLTDGYLNSLNFGEKWPTGAGFSEVPIGNPDDRTRQSLEASASAIAALIRAGAYVQDLSQTYCVECVFSSKEKPARLQSVNFDASFLRRARFDNAQLTGASFRNAALIGTFFNSANLAGALLTADIPATPWQQFSAMSSGTTMALYGANFSCANLNSADFSGRATFIILYNNPVYGVFGDSFGESNLSGAKFDNIQMIVGFPRRVIDDAGGAEKLNFRKVFAVVTGQWSGPSDPVPSIKGADDYYLYTFTTGESFRIEDDLDLKSYWDLILQLRNLNGARNFDRAILPKGLRDFIDKNKTLISVSLGKPQC